MYVHVKLMQEVQIQCEISEFGGGIKSKLLEEENTIFCIEDITYAAKSHIFGHDRLYIRNL